MKQASFEKNPSTVFQTLIMPRHTENFTAIALIVKSESTYIPYKEFIYFETYASHTHKFSLYYYRLCDNYAHTINWKLITMLTFVIRRLSKKVASPLKCVM